MKCINCEKEITGRGKTDKCRSCAISSAMKSFYVNGGIPWNKGSDGKYISGKNNPMYGRNHSNKTKEKMATINRNRKHEKHTKETRKKISEAQRGEKHWNWQGGLSSLRIQAWHTYLYKQWRKTIFERDNYICQECGIRGGVKLNVDHYPKSFAQIMRENDIKSLDEIIECQELWDTNNGRTLCVSCHKKTPTWGKTYQYNNKLP